ncbi:MAG: hypothetical protein HZA72_02155, partial [Candidatus Omnitrophica bacterium]|nr:hypothetical protein [Candidatus Omnitrophota bacterium]
ARLDELASLSGKNDIESGRLYMSVNEKYYNEATEYLDKAAGLTKSKDLAIDIYFLRCLIFKEKFQPQAQEAVFNEMVNSISQYSVDPALNKKKLLRVADIFNKKGLPDYSTKLKIAYASKMGGEDARDLFEEIRTAADQYFAKGDLKQAGILYEQYIKLIEPYLKKEEAAAKIMEIAERYFASAIYKEARKYYELYLEKYSDSKVADYASYKLALCCYYERNLKESILRLEDFLKTYPNSIWFDKAFENICKLYYENFAKLEAIEKLQELIDKYYRKNTGDYAYILMALLYYGDKDYDNASLVLKKVDPASIYSYAGDMIEADMKAIKDSGSRPSFGYETSYTYKMWDPYKPIAVELVPVEAKGAGGILGVGGKEQKFNVTRAGDGTTRLDLNRRSRVEFQLDGLEDMDKFSEYFQDQGDKSRLPKKTGEGTVKDLLSLHWACEGGRFLDEKETRTKVWEAPDEMGAYKITVTIDDFGLIRSPDKGLRKDSTKEVSLTVKIED